MRRFMTMVLIMALFIITAQAVEAQRPDERGERPTRADLLKPGADDPEPTQEPGLQSLDDGSFHPDALDPADGTIIADFGPTQNAPEGAEGRAIVMWLRTQGVARVNVNVENLDPRTRYEVLMINHQPSNGRIHSLTTFTTDDEGSGHANVIWYDSFPFNAVNVRLPATPGSAVLSTLARVGGLQQQVPGGGVVR